MTAKGIIVNIFAVNTKNKYWDGHTMIKVTERAKQELGRLLAASVDWPGACLRLVDRGQGKLGMGIDIQQSNDRAIEYEGSILLVIDDGLADSLTHITLDVDDSPEGTELVICEELPESHEQLVSTT